jgi:hypothetical protein
MKKWSFVVLLVVGATILGSTVLREPIASAAQTVGTNIIGPLDAQGNVKVHEQGTASVAITNTADVQLSIPAGAFSSLQTEGSPPGTRPVFSGPDPAGTNYAITSITVANPNATPAQVDVFAKYGTTNDCQTFPTGLPKEFIGPYIEVPANDTVHLDFPQPFVVSAQAGDNSCLVSNLDGNPQGDVITVVGYRF